MATLKLAIIPAKVLKSGKHKIRIAIGHKQETRYIVTKYIVDSPNQLKDGTIINRPDASVLNVKLRNLLNSYQEAIDKILASEYSPRELAEYLKDYRTTTLGTATFEAAYKVFIAEKIEYGKKGTVMLYEYSSKYFSESAKGDILLDAIAPKTIKSFERSLYMRGLGDTSVTMHMRHIKAVINEAIRSGMVKYETHPFEYWKRPDPIVRDLDLTLEEVRIIRDSTPKEKSLRMARDLFMLSYYLGGINLIDLLKIDFKKSTFVIEYIRTKTKDTKTGNKKVCLTIPAEARTIIAEWISKSGKLDFGYQYSYPNFRNYATKELQRLSKILNIEKHIVFYSARKSLTQHGFELGVPLEVLEYTIGQSVKKNRPIFNYVKIMREHADKAMKRIIDHLFERDKKKRLTIKRKPLRK